MARISDSSNTLLTSTQLRDSDLIPIGRSGNPTARVTRVDALQEKIGGDSGGGGGGAGITTSEVRYTTPNSSLPSTGNATLAGGQHISVLTLQGTAPSWASILTASPAGNRIQISEAGQYTFRLRDTIARTGTVGNRAYTRLELKHYGSSGNDEKDIIIQDSNYYRAGTETGISPQGTGPGIWSVTQNTGLITVAANDRFEVLLITWSVGSDSFARIGGNTYLNIKQIK